MITKLSSNRILIISDIHLGNPFCKARSRMVEFLRWADNEGYDVVINGDGFEIAQVSFTRIARDVPDVFHAMKAFTRGKRALYYIVGNHDMAFENLLDDWGGFRVAPFLNVDAGPKRIRIEHGHLYDPFFVKNPEMYEFCTWLAGFFLNVNPSLYKLWIKFEKLRSLFWKKSDIGIQGEHPNFLKSASELANRGFDSVIFGHTHHAGKVALPNGSEYYNTGSWLVGSDYIKIVDGHATLCKWEEDRLTELKGKKSLVSAS